MLGLAPLGTVPLGADLDDFRVSFELPEEPTNGSILQVATLVDRALIERLRLHPEDLRSIDRRLFEQLIAELFSGFGYEVELTQRTRDGGKDIVAVKRSEVDVRFLIECKRPDPGNPIGVSTVRELYGVKVDDGASKAILATTTYFTPDARRFSNKHVWELELRDYEAIRQWISKYLGESSSR